MDLNQINKTKNILNNYPSLLDTLTGKNSEINLKCDGRVLRRDSERLRLRKSRRFRKHPYQRIKQFEKALFSAMDHEKLALFTCPKCNNVLNCPVTVECGHTFCKDCLDENFGKCGKCFMDLSGQSPKVNILVQNLVEKWRERNKTQEVDIPDAVDILGLKPRYVLRSGYAGLQFTIESTMKEKKEEINRVENIDCLLKDKYERPRKRCKFSKSFEKYYKENERDDNSFQKMLDNIFKEVDSIKEKALRNSWNCIALDDFECLLCSRCLLDPVTTSCGHTFCRDCLTRVLDHRLTCPLCISTLSVCEYFKETTEVLDQAIRFIIPEEINCRLRSNLGDIVVDGSTNIPVFVCTNAFPGVACPLYVYEPRYRLLVRRRLQSVTKQFAMVSMDPNGGSKFAQYGTILDVKDAVTLNDGRIILTTLGVRRFRVVSRGEQDGYDTAKIEHINDVIPPPEKLADLVFLHQKVFSKAAKWVRLLTPSVLFEVERLIGVMPKIEKDWIQLPDGPAWTWWLMPILPLSSQLQVGFLSSTSLEKRLRAIDKMLEHMKIRMKALQREESVTCTSQEENLEFCSQSQNC